jgi:hypothetical protein
MSLARTFKPLTVGALSLAFAANACTTLFEGAQQCNSDRDCVRFGIGTVCASDGVCVARTVAESPTADAAASVPAPRNAPDASTPTAPPPAPPPPADAAVDTGPVPGVLASITVTPPTASILNTRTQQFTATARDGLGNLLTPQPSFTWTVAGGGTINTSGLFTAADAPGGPFMVRAASGALNATASISVTVSILRIGETNVLTVDDTGNGGLLLAQRATLAKPAVIRSLHFYVSQAVGNVRLGLYDATGPEGGPGAKKAETAEFLAKVGWNNVPVMATASLAAGNYWLAYAPSDTNLHFPRAGDNTGNFAYQEFTYGPLPATFSTTPTTGTDHWSFYATLTE